MRASPATVLVAAWALLLPAGVAAAPPPPDLSPEQVAVWEQLVTGAVTRQHIEIVVAACHDNLDWLRAEYRALASVHDQCALPASDNVGRESHVYLQHIVDNFDRLAEWTVFSQGHAPAVGYEDLTREGRGTQGGHLVRGATFDDYVLAFGQAHRQLYVLASSAVRVDDDANYRHSLRTAYLTDGPTARRGPWGVATCPPPRNSTSTADPDHWTGWVDLPVASEGERAFERLYKANAHHVRATGVSPPSALDYFTGLVAGHDAMLHQRQPGVLLFAQGARFAVRRSAVHGKPRAFYQALLQEVSRDNDPVCGYYNEWMWPWIVAEGIDCETPAFDVVASPEHQERLLASTSAKKKKEGSSNIFGFVAMGVFGVGISVLVAINNCNNQARQVAPEGAGVAVDDAGVIEVQAEVLGDL